MMQNAPLDEHVKKRLGDYEPEVPPHIWENIMARKDKKRPFGLWLSLFQHKQRLLVAVLALVISGACITLFLYNKQSTKNISSIQLNDKSSAQQNAEEKVNSIEQIRVNNLPDKPNSTADNIDVSNTDETPKEHLKDAVVPATTETVKSTVSVPAQDLSKKKTTKLVALTKGENKNNQDTENEIINDRDDKKANHRNKLTRKANSSNAVSVISSESETDISLEDELPVSKLNPAGKDLYLDRLILSLQSMYPEKSFLGTIKKPNIPTVSIPCPESERDAAANKRYFEIYGGPDYAIRSFDDTANSAYMQKRKESTRFASAFSAGIRYTRVFNNAMSFRTGINFSQVNEKFTFVQGNIIQVVYVTDANGDTTGSYATTATRYKTTFNKYRTIDIPLLIGYEMGNGRFHTNLSAGVIVNVYSWQKGDVLDTAYKPISISTGGNASPYQFKTNMGIGLMGSASVYYKLNKRLHLLAEPYIRYNMSAANKADITLKQKFTTIGLRLGLRMDF